MPPSGIDAQVWDRPVRWLHWSLAAACAGAWLTTEVGLRWHEPVGYAAVFLVAVRGAWGFVGGRHARFADFVRSPRATWAYARLVARGRAPRYLGHNPLGGWMALALWAGIALLGFTGWLYSTDAFWGEAWLDRTHQVLGWSALALVALHLGGVAHSAWRHKDRLVAAMFTGRKRAAGPQDVD